MSRFDDNDESNDAVNLGHGTVVRETKAAILVFFRGGTERQAVVHADSDVWKIGQEGDVKVKRWWAESEALQMSRRGSRRKRTDVPQVSWSDTPEGRLAARDGEYGLEVWRAERTDGFLFGPVDPGVFEYRYSVFEYDDKGEKFFVSCGSIRGGDAVTRIRAKAAAVEAVRLERLDKRMRREAL